MKLLVISHVVFFARYEHIHYLIIDLDATWSEKL